MQHTLRTSYWQNGHTLCVHIPLGQQLLSSRPILWSSKPRAALALRGTAVLLGGSWPCSVPAGLGAPRREAAPGPPAPSWQGAAWWCAGKSNQAIIGGSPERGETFWDQNQGLHQGQGKQDVLRSFSAVLQQQVLTRPNCR